MENNEHGPVTLNQLRQMWRCYLLDPKCRVRNDTEQPEFFVLKTDKKLLEFLKGSRKNGSTSRVIERFEIDGDVVTVLAGGKAFAVHKTLLLNHSPFFRKLLEEDQKEVPNRVELPDTVSAESFQLIVRLLYLMGLHKSCNLSLMTGTPKLANVSVDGFKPHVLCAHLLQLDPVIRIFDKHLTGRSVTFLQHSITLRTAIVSIYLPF